MPYLKLNFGQASNKGRKRINQDAVAAQLPDYRLLALKGAAFAVADGVSSSQVSQIASQTAVKNFMSDYYCTSPAWSVESSIARVVQSLNAWLYAQSQRAPSRYERDKGYICTFTSLVLRSNTAYIAHVGDSLVLRIRKEKVEQLTEVHRRELSAEVSFLTRGLGIDQVVSIQQVTTPIKVGDIFLLATDGIFEAMSQSQVVGMIREFKGEDFDVLAKNLLDKAYAQGSKDNLSVQIVCVEKLPSVQVSELNVDLEQLKIPPNLRPRTEFDGYQVLRRLYSSPRSHVYLVRDMTEEKLCVIKTPTQEYQHDKGYLEQFLLEEWIAHRLNSPHVLKALPHKEQSEQRYLYTLMEYIEGQTLRQWMIDNPHPSIDQVRRIINQVAKGLQAFHRQEMIYQDLRPENIMIDQNAVVKLIDFGAVYVPGIDDIRSQARHNVMPGTQQYSAPEYFLNQRITAKADVFSLAVITYEMLMRRLPYGNKIAQAQSNRAIKKLQYEFISATHSGVPRWFDLVLKRGLEIDSNKRFSYVSEFVYELNSPSKNFTRIEKLSLMERYPLQFWQTVSALLALTVVLLLLFY